MCGPNLDVMSHKFIVRGNRHTGALKALSPLFFVQNDSQKLEAVDMQAPESVR